MRLLNDIDRRVEVPVELEGVRAVVVAERAVSTPLRVRRER
jgi:hypothetical protein